MKIAKRATQKNVIINGNYYTLDAIKNMFENGEVFFFTDVAYGTSSNYDEWYWSYSNFEEPPAVRIFTEKLSEIKVALDDGFYTTVAIGKNGTKYYISL